MLYLEEAAFLDLNVFFEIVVPLLEMQTTSLIAISTPQSKLNFYSEMFELKNQTTGEAYFRTFSVSLICESCKKLGIGTTCRHKSDLIPPWKSIQKLDLVKSLFAERRDVMERESMGQITDDSTSLFSTDMVMELLDRKETIPDDIEAVVVGVDPNGGGASHMAIVTLAVHNSEIIIIGMESHPAQGHDEIKNILLSHLKGVRAIPQLKAALIVFCPEANLGQESSHMAHMVKHLPRLYTLRETPKKPGMITTFERKELYAMTTLGNFNTRKIRLCRDNDFVCLNPYGDANKRATVVKNMFKQQMISFRKIEQPGPQPWSLSKFIYTGKVKRGANDDIAMTLQFTLYWAIEFNQRRITNVPYQELFKT